MPGFPFDGETSEQRLLELADEHDRVLADHVAAEQIVRAEEPERMRRAAAGEPVSPAWVDFAPVTRATTALMRAAPGATDPDDAKRRIRATLAPAASRGTVEQP